MGAASDTLILGTRKGALVLQRHAAGWKITRGTHLGTSVPYAMVDPRTGQMWASLEHGHWGQKLHRSPDMGATWEDPETPKYPDGAEINDGFPGQERPARPATLRYMWVLAPGGADQPQTFYVGTEPGGLFRTDNGGESFELVEGLWNHPTRPAQWFGGGRDYPGIHSIWVDPRDSRHVMVAISCAGVFETRDGGESWRSRNHGLKASFLPEPWPEVGFDPHFMTVSPSNADVLWQQNHDGIFRSTDGAKSWTEISQAGGPARFGFSIAVDEEAPDTAWVVPATADAQRTAIDGKLCVCRTQDGGRTWETLSGGLPQENSYDIVFRHGLDISGDRLAFGSTTGNAFVSDDRGESWECLGNYFPPIYSVRFVHA